jgi:hypothetical protein
LEARQVSDSGKTARNVRFRYCITGFSGTSFTKRRDVERDRENKRLRTIGERREMRETEKRKKQRCPFAALARTDGT